MSDAGPSPPPGSGVAGPAIPLWQSLDSTIVAPAAASPVAKPPFSRFHDVTKPSDSRHGGSGRSPDTRKHMKHVGSLCQTLLVPARLRTALSKIGEREHFTSQSVLFRAGDKNAGAFLVCTGEVCLHVPGVPHLSRTFSQDSILGLPSTFSDSPYSLTAVSVSDSEVIHIDKAKLLELMQTQPDLCRDANDVLCREVAFILSALRRQPMQPTGEAGITRARRTASQ